MHHVPQVGVSVAAAAAVLCPIHFVRVRFTCCLPPGSVASRVMQQLDLQSFALSSGSQSA